MKRVKILLKTNPGYVKSVSIWKCNKVSNFGRMYVNPITAISYPPPIACQFLHSLCMNIMNIMKCILRPRLCLQGRTQVKLLAWTCGMENIPKNYISTLKKMEKNHPPPPLESTTGKTLWIQFQTDSCKFSNRAHVIK